MTVIDSPPPEPLGDEEDGRGHPARPWREPLMMRPVTRWAVGLAGVVLAGLTACQTATSDLDFNERWVTA